MFFKLSLLAFIAPIVCGLVLQTPSGVVSGQDTTIHWTNQQGDPTTWTFELNNPTFNSALAIANNVDPSASSITLQVPAVPARNDYTLMAVNIGNISDVFALTGQFAIANTGSSSSVSGSSTTSSSATSSKASPTTPLTTSNSVASSVSAGFSSVIVTPSAASSSSSAASSASSGAATTPSSAALSSRLSFGSHATSIAAVLLSAVAGAAVLAL